MKTKRVPKEYQHISPAGAEVRLLMGNVMGGLAHCTLCDGKISKAVRHKTVSEFWYIISGSGEIWRRQDKVESVTHLETGISIDIPLGTDFQYRATKGSDLVFICITMPPWPGADEVSYLERGQWEPALKENISL